MLQSALTPLTALDTKRPRCRPTLLTLVAREAISRSTWAASGLFKDKGSDWWRDARNLAGARHPASPQVRERRHQWSIATTKHMPEGPVANRSKKGSGNHHEIVSDTTGGKRFDDLNASEQGDTANIKQNSPNKGFFRGRRM